MEEKILDHINYKLSAIIGLIAEERIKNMDGERKVDYLSKLGLERDIIAVICGIKPKSVTETLSRVRAKERKKEKEKEKRKRESRKASIEKE